ncbi:MAG TPA: hypothetical protein VII38_00225 [Polyangia bacterium]
MRACATTFLLLVAIAGQARADLPLAPPDPPRWRLRASLLSGAGGSTDGHATAMFPTTLEFGARVWKPLSIDVAAQAVLAGEEYEACGRPRRPNAILGSGGLRVDFKNGRSASWVAPFVEAHLGVGRQGPGREQNGLCSGPPTFFTGGARLGLDIWLGRVAVTVAVSYDYLPTAAPVSASIGASVVLF